MEEELKLRSKKNAIMRLQHEQNERNFEITSKKEAWREKYDTFVMKRDQSIFYHKLRTQMKWSFAMIRRHHPKLDEYCRVDKEMLNNNEN